MRVLAALGLLAGLVAAAHAETPAERGRYLATVGDCVACHTAPGGIPFAGGRPIETPFGPIIAPNLTPDRASGLGAWSDADFLAALKRGLRPDGTRLYPACPYVYFSAVRDEDLLAIRAFLATLAPIANPARGTGFVFPFNLRPLMLFWDALYFRPAPFVPDPAHSAAWNRGAYLVEGLGHCGACHSAKGALGADREPGVLGGGRVRAWFAPDLGGDPRAGLGGWSLDDIARYLATGSNGRALAAGPMAEVVENSTARLTAADLGAIALYLKQDASLSPPFAGPSPAPNDRIGAAIYADACAACHRTKGEGVPGLFPRLAGSAVVQSAQPDTLITVVLHGSRAAATGAAPTGPAMPALGWRLDDASVAAVLTYIRSAWGNEAAPVSGDAVRRGL